MSRVMQVTHQADGIQEQYLKNITNIETRSR